ncbi:MAG TPA: hypothetical protein VGC83_07895 [Solirubrobacteraceae bacterium]
MQEPRAQRTLVKSPPELWAEVSDVEALARHLGEFGEIRITRLEPETTVAWEGDRACGTVALEPSGWGTKVTITAKLAAEPAPEPVAVEPEPEPAPPAGEAAMAEPVAEAEPEPDVPEPVAEAEPEPEASEPIAEAEPDVEAPKEGFFARLFGRRRKVESVVDVEPEPEPLAAEPESEAEPVAVEPEPEPEPLAAEPEPEAMEAKAEAEPQPPPLDAERAEAILTGVLDDLGSAHHRPFSRA